MLEWISQTLDHSDKLVFSFVHTTLRSPLLDFLMPFISNKWYWAVPITGVLLYAFAKDKRGGWLLLFSGIFLIFLVDASATALKGQVLRPRPLQNPSLISMLVERPASSSFPSNHAANSFALATLLGIYYPRIAGIFFAAATLVGFSRVYLGTHYPLDILAGALLGTLIGLLVAMITQGLRVRMNKGGPSGWSNRLTGR